MSPSVNMRSDTAYTLNFLVYIQNLYVNQRSGQGEERYKFPYLSGREIPFLAEFEREFAKVWADVASPLLAEEPFYDLNLFKSNQELVYERLFVQEEDCYRQYFDIYQSFLAWWNSWAGRFALDQGFDNRKLYDALMAAVQATGGELRKTFEISILYDACTLGDEEVFPYFAIMPYADCLLKEEVLVAKLKACLQQ
ncbi:hypothetical protein [Paenibacillus sp. CF384]|uniref:hypothetical protein n=1 Tax=Paenibacillus sp. CF384 TaxID=1884382 RepID=UPI00089A5C7B|nr:hypothetical protein [Paenibacillus sp. CF384]SDW23621.1 hypothetical protein SAMN05518855_1001752 [Paenibacillus sp. CF384]